VRYGLSPAVVRDFVQAGLLRPAPAPDAVLIDEPDDLPRLARLHHELDLAPEALDIILAMRQRLVQLQAALVHETTRPAWYFSGAGPHFVGYFSEHLVLMQRLTYQAAPLLGWVSS